MHLFSMAMLLVPSLPAPFSQRTFFCNTTHKKAIHVDDFVEITISSRKMSKQRRIDEMLQTLQDSDTLVVTELSRLGRSTAEVIELVNELVSRNIRVITLKQNLDINKNDMNSKIIITLFSSLLSWSEI